MLESIGMLVVSILGFYSLIGILCFLLVWLIGGRYAVDTIFNDKHNDL